MRKYQCARGSIDAAISALTSNGFVYSRQGSGTFVSPTNGVTQITEIHVIDNFTTSRPSGDEGESGQLAASLQSEWPCYLWHRNEVAINMPKIMKPGSAVIWIRPSYSHLMMMQHLENAGIPQLLIGRTFSRFDYVTTDAKAGIKNGLEWLTSTSGTKNITFIHEHNHPDFPFVAERQIAFYESCVELGIKLKPDSIIDLPLIDPGTEIGNTAKQLFLGENCPKAIFLTYIQIAFSLITLAEAFGKKPGKDFHILVFDRDLSLMKRAGVGMLYQRWDKMASLAVEWIHTVSKTGEYNFKKLLEPELLTFQS
jgi:hypothetical protein